MRSYRRYFGRLVVERRKRVEKIKNLYHAYSYEYVVSPRGKHVPSSPVNDLLVAILLVA